MNYSELLAALDQATPFDLFRLQTAITAMLQDPHRLKAIKNALAIGQQIEYFEPTENRLIQATVIALNRTRILVRNTNDGQQWHFPYYYVNVQGVDTTINPAPQSTGLNKNSVKVGDHVGFHDARTQTDIYGEVIRRNTKTVTLDTHDGLKWRVSYHLLFSVMDQKRVIDVLPPPQAESQS